MALREVLCSLLLGGPAHGYQLQATLEAELGPLWATRASQVYLTLGRMQRDGLVVSRRVRQATRPDRQLLRLTERGHAVATDWLFAPGPADEIVVRLALARLVLPDRFAELATLILDERTRALRALRALRDEVDGGFQREAVEAELYRIYGELRWLAGGRDRSEELVAMRRGTRPSNTSNRGGKVAGLD
jgi:DNA-binding PadR family transcriptional regulator